MPSNESEITKRAKIALRAIKAAYGTEDDEYGATLFVSHHLAEIESGYWQKHFQTNSPRPQQILDSLILHPETEDEVEPDSLDFTLPGGVTDYVICVSFDEDGQVEDICMES